MFLIDYDLVTILYPSNYVSVLPGPFKHIALEVLLEYLNTSKVVCKPMHTWLVTGASEMETTS